MVQECGSAFGGGGGGSSTGSTGDAVPGFAAMPINPNPDGALDGEGESVPPGASQPVIVEDSLPGNAAPAAADPKRAAASAREGDATTTPAEDAEDDGGDGDAPPLMMTMTGPNVGGGATTPTDCGGDSTGSGGGGGMEAMNTTGWPVCMVQLMPSPEFLQCTMQAAAAGAVAQAVAAGSASMPAMPAATSSCAMPADASASDDSGDAMQAVAMTFPCFQTIMASSVSAGMSFMTGGTPVCPTPEYACNCFATIADACPMLAAAMMQAGSESGGEAGGATDGNTTEGGCGSSSTDSVSMSAECDAFQAAFDVAGGFVAACPANFAADGTVTVLTDALATTAPIISTTPPAAPEV